MENWQLQQRINLPLDLKIKMSQRRIKSWFDHWLGEIYISFSGGKDSTVLLHLVRNVYPDISAVFVDTGLEYPEIRNFVKTIDNVTWLKPKMSFRKVLEKYGYPIISKDQSCAITRYRNTKSNEVRYKRLYGFPGGNKGTISKKWQYLINAPFKISDRCCDIIKKAPLDHYAKETGKKPITGVMFSESNKRRFQYLKQGCNGFDYKKPISWPLAFWTEKDIWEYIKRFNISYSEIYDMGEIRTGCMFCCFGVHLESNPNRFQRMQKTHPAQYKYCIYKLGIGKVLDYMKIPYSKQLDLAKL